MVEREIPFQLEMHRYAPLRTELFRASSIHRAACSSECITDFKLKSNDESASFRAMSSPATSKVELLAAWSIPSRWMCVVNNTAGGNVERLCSVSVAAASRGNTRGNVKVAWSRLNIYKIEPRQWSLLDGS